jgi:phage virion morphogenesis protein
MSEIRLEVKSNEVTAELSKLQRRLSNPKKLMTSISVELLSLTEEAFEQEGPKWQELAEATIERRKARGHWPGKMLQISAGGLAASIQPFSSNKEAGLSSAKPYAAIHQFGGKAGRGHKSVIPARPYMPIRLDGSDLALTQDASDSILSLMRDFVDGKIG